MNLRKAIAALVSLPATARVSVAQLKPTDVIVVECDHPLTPNERARIKAALAIAWPDHRCVVIDRGMHLKIARSDESIA